jgi:hypothetical protein
MPKYEKIRNKREQAFRKLTLATVPKRNIVPRYHHWAKTTTFGGLGRRLTIGVPQQTA